jgi:hypothetical protein
MRRFRYSLMAFALLAATVLLACRPSVAADPRDRPKAMTDLNQVDDDFPFQGEFYGNIALIGGGPWQTLGLQVAAQGGGDYIAVEYEGGLPGIGWYGGDKIHLHGRREPDRLILKGLNRQYEVGNDGIAWFFDENGEKLTWLTKVNRISPTLGQLPPENAVLLFGGVKNPLLSNARITPDGLLKEGAVTRDSFQDFFLHIEFQLPYMPEARGQGRSNSGVYLQKRYEVQILDSFALEGKFNECGSLYRYRSPSINMCLPPLAWQTYDIDFHSARFDIRGAKTQNAMITMWHNGFPIHEQLEIRRKTGNGKPETLELLPILLQDHHNPVRFRNIWLMVNSKEMGRYIPGLPLSVYHQPGDSYGVVRLHRN